jgi:DNA-binding CsgD family transcriptional regulator
LARLRRECGRSVLRRFSVTVGQLVTAAGAGGGGGGGAGTTKRTASISVSEPSTRVQTAIVFLSGRSLLRSGRRTQAADAFTDARDRFASMGAVLWEARVVEELERASPGRSEGVLTPAERRIAELVAEGMRNREIASTLFMSVGTVEAHLTRIYRKLGIRSRSELARLM